MEWTKGTFGPQKYPMESIEFGRYQLAFHTVEKKEVHKLRVKEAGFMNIHTEEIPSGMPKTEAKAILLSWLHEHADKEAAELARITEEVGKCRQAHTSIGSW